MRQGSVRRSTKFVYIMDGHCRAHLRLCEVFERWIMWHGLNAERQDMASRRETQEWMRPLNISLATCTAFEPKKKLRKEKHSYYGILDNCLCHGVAHQSHHNLYAFGKIKWVHFYCHSRSLSLSPLLLVLGLFYQTKAKCLCASAWAFSQLKSFSLFWSWRTTYST